MKVSHGAYFLQILRFVYKSRPMNDNHDIAAAAAKLRGAGETTAPER